VSTRTTRAPPGRAALAVSSHRAEVSLPEPGAGELEDTIRPHTPDEIGERPADRRRVRSLPAQPDGLLQELLIKHKICTFHAHRIDLRPRPVNAASAY
jgi:hypothetical protein